MAAKKKTTTRRKKTTRRSTTSPARRRTRRRRNASKDTEMIMDVGSVVAGAWTSRYVRNMIAKLAQNLNVGESSLGWFELGSSIAMLVGFDWLAKRRDFRQHKRSLERFAIAGVATSIESGLDRITGNYGGTSVSGQPTRSRYDSQGIDGTVTARFRQLTASTRDGLPSPRNPDTVARDRGQVPVSGTVVTLADVTRSIRTRA